MNGAFYIAANINTPAFKRSSVRFSEIMASQLDAGTVRADLGQSLIETAGVRSEAQFMLDEQGRVESTGQPMDLAINGRGFIELMGSEGQTLLWRGGTLKIGDNGLLASASGLPLKAAITAPADATSIQIGSDGVVRAIAGSGTDPVEIGQIMLVRIENPETVERLDGGLYRVTDDTKLTDAKPGEDGVGQLVQGSLERSTVELTSEMVQMMLVQRAYAANAQVAQAADQMMALANGLRR
jgi:flagellar basal-body rod protein FlgG